MMVSITGSWTPDVKAHNIPMASKEACLKAGKWAASNSTGSIGYVCISSETGEVIRIEK